jgi:hypothetical protein
VKLSKIKQSNLFNSSLGALIKTSNAISKAISAVGICE